MSGVGEVQNVTATEALNALAQSPTARLVDVRTKAEWIYVGLPDLSALGTEPVLLEWQTFPDMTVDETFGDALQSACPERSAALYFLCRSGVRSLAAAREMGMRGYANVFNVADGFEGPPDDKGHRGRLAGWKAEGLPWRQS
ncbi:MAG: rhodanese-like domain-containing protein [Pseudomonadota bacterium]